MSKNKPLSKILQDRLNAEFENKIFFEEHYNIIENQGTKDVIIRDDIPPVRVKATKWFSDIWLYIKIEWKRIISDDKMSSGKIVPFISICVFQQMEDSLIALFRAEWDNYQAEKEYNHPQPHWHFYNSKNEDINNFESLEKDCNGIDKALKEDPEPMNLSKMHFAMAGNWIGNGEMATKYIDDNQIVDWIFYLLKHIKEEINYINQ